MQLKDTRTTSTKYLNFSGMLQVRKVLVKQVMHISGPLGFRDGDNSWAGEAEKRKRGKRRGERGKRQDRSRQVSNDSSRGRKGMQQYKTKVWVRNEYGMLWGLSVRLKSSFQRSNSLLRL